MTIQNFITIYKKYKNQGLKEYDLYNLISLIDVMENHPERKKIFKKDYINYNNFFRRFFNYSNNQIQNNIIEDIIRNNLDYKHTEYLPLSHKNIILFTLNKIFKFESDINLYKRLLRNKMMNYKSLENNYIRYDRFMDELDEFYNEYDKNDFNNFIDFVSIALRNEMMYEAALYGIYTDFNDVPDNMNIYPYVIGQLDNKIYYKKEMLLDLDKISFLSVPWNKAGFDNAIRNYTENPNKKYNESILYWDGLNFANSIDDAQHRNSIASILKSSNIYSEYIVNIKDNFLDLSLIKTKSIFNDEEFTLLYQDEEFAIIPDVRFAMLFEIEKDRYIYNKNN